MAHDILLALWFFLPAGAANVAPIFAAKLPIMNRLDIPMDCGLTFGGKRLLGDHKTWRGLVAGLILSVITVYLQAYGYAHVAWIRNISMSVNYQQLPLLSLGLLLGFGALGGDAAKSFFKRRRNIPAGESWIPFDQADLIIGAIIVTVPIITLNLAVYIWATVLWSVIQLLSTIAGYLLRLKERPI